LQDLIKAATRAAHHQGTEIMKAINAKEFKNACRAYSRSNSKFRPTHTESLVRVYGYELAYLVEKFEHYKNQLGTTNIHVRTNYRAYAVAQFSHQEWLSQAKRLTLSWRYFDTTKKHK